MAVRYHCPCLETVSTVSVPPRHAPLSDFEHHALASLLFCEECDAIRCDLCALNEVACYFCPSCMFEVPSASVRSERNRCARNCFQCPQCDNTLAVVMSESTDKAKPYILTCSACYWNSREVGISFEKPTVQLQAVEEASPELLEFEKIRDHLEPYVRRGQAASTSAPTRSSVLKDVPGLASRYPSLLSSTSQAARLGRNADLRARDELVPYKSTTRLDDDVVMTQSDRVDSVRMMKSLYDVPSASQRWTSSWNAPSTSREMKPQRTPLQAKRAKRCPECKHILIKPEPKASSTRYKIKLIASNYLPSISIQRRAPPTVSSRMSVVPNAPSSSSSKSTASFANLRDDPLRPGRTYTYELALTNPLFEPIKVKLAVARPTSTSSSSSSSSSAGKTNESPPFAVHLPAPSFEIDAFAEDWEYEDHASSADDDDSNDDDDGAADERKKRKSKKQGIVSRKMNTTTVLMDVAVSKQAERGPLHANMLVTYVYTDDLDAAAGAGHESKKGSAEKTFTFWTLVFLGTVSPRTATTATTAAAAAAAAP